MSWAKLDDGFWMHPKIIAVGNEGAGAFARMLSYCGCYLTDGLVPVAIVDTICGKRTLAEKLEQAGLIQLLESGSAFIPDYLELNLSKAQVEADRQRRAEAGRKGGKASQQSRRGQAYA